MLFLDEADALETVHINENFLDQHADIVKRVGVKSDYWRILCRCKVYLAVAKFALLERQHEFAADLCETSKMYAAYIQLIMYHRFDDRAVGRDAAENADVEFSYCLSLLASCGDSAEVETICKETDYGDFLGDVKYSFSQAAFCRILRAHFLHDHARFEREICEIGETSSTKSPVSHFGFLSSSKQYQALMMPILMENSVAFQIAAKRFSDWYHGRVLKDFVTSGGYSYSATVNPVLSAVCRVAFDRCGWKLSFEDEFLVELPEENQG